MRTHSCAPVIIQENGQDRVGINVKVAASFSDNLFATHFVLKIPVPPNTARARIRTANGRAKYEPEQGAIVWR